MSDGRVLSVGKLGDYPPSAWGTHDKLAMLDGTGLGKTANVIAPPAQPTLGFRLFEPPTVGGARAKAVDDMLDQLGVRPRR
jgi:hypothetical protein